MFKALNIVMIVLLLISVGLQYNDPDPIRWMSIYGVAAILSIAEGKLGKIGVIAPVVVAVVALLWAAIIAHGMKASVTTPELFRRMDPNRPEIEEGREIGGLLIVAAWMVVLAVRSYIRRS
ncbi:MAG TPA: transmembrane 220 family protein [Acidobacteriota bacterium]|jgi:hypothetical protein